MTAKQKSSPSTFSGRAIGPVVEVALDGVFVLVVWVYVADVSLVRVLVRTVVMVVRTVVLVRTFAVVLVNVVVAVATLVVAVTVVESTAVLLFSGDLIELIGKMAPCRPAARSTSFEPSTMVMRGLPSSAAAPAPQRPDETPLALWRLSCSLALWPFRKHMSDRSSTPRALPQVQAPQPGTSAHLPRHSLALGTLCISPSSDHAQ
mmetsp:Transcript_87428/g.228092  ORF Transcript_87428/g.228092 Transcript_87428/m.228092 type:complete len:205 (-) Transcript_87428:72-686(-)